MIENNYLQRSLTGIARHGVERMAKVSLFVALLCMSAGLHAQERRHELRIGLGWGRDAHLNDVQEGYVADFNLEKTSFPVFSGIQLHGSLDYFYRLNERWSVGGTFGIATVDDAGVRMKWDDVSKEKGVDNAVGYVIGGIFYELFSGPDIRIRSNSQFLMPMAKYSWISGRRFSLYSKVALGLQHYSLDVECYDMPFPERDESKIKPVYQLSPVGIDFGGRLIRGYLEAGYGKQGYLSMGLAIRF